MERGLDMLGDGIPIYGGIFSTLGNLGQGIVAAQEKSEAGDKAKADDAAKLDAAIAADSAAAMAKASALTAATFAKSATPGKVKTDADAKSAAADAALSVASSAQDTAGAALSPALTPKRAEVAQKAFAAATQKLQADPKSVFGKSLVSAWSWCQDRIQNKQITSADSKGDKPKDEGSFFSRKIIGPLTPTHLLVGGGVGVGLWYCIKRGVFKRLFGG